MIPTKSMELWLAGWRETHNGGFKVTFDVPPEDAAFFRADTGRDGKMAGQRYAVVLVKLGADEKPVPLPKEPATKLVSTDVIPPRHPLAQDDDGKKGSPGVAKPHFPGGLCGLAVRWCDDDHFQLWLSSWYTNTSPEELTAEWAKDAICFTCGIKSRKELDTNPEAAKVFRDSIRDPYVKVRREDGVDDEGGK